MQRTMHVCVKQAPPAWSVRSCWTNIRKPQPAERWLGRRGRREVVSTWLERQPDSGSQPTAAGQHVRSMSQDAPVRLCKEVFDDRSEPTDPGETEVR